jgi:hypothetical protein
MAADPEDLHPKDLHLEDSAWPDGTVSYERATTRA